MNRPVVRVVGGILVALILITAAGGAFMAWKLSGLKQQLVAQLENAIGAQVQITSLDLDLWKGEMHAAGLTLTNDRVSAPWQKGGISQVTVRYHFADLFASTLPLTVEVSSWNLLLVPSTASAAGTVDSTTPASALPLGGTAISEDTSGASSKRRIQVTQIVAHEGSVEIDLADNRQVMISGVEFTAADNGAGVWTTDAQAAAVTAGSFQGGASSLKIRGEQDKITFSDLHISCAQGVITGDGNMATAAPHDVLLTLKATDVPMTMLVAVQWQMKLSGLVSGDLTYSGNEQTGYAAKGQLAASHAKFNVIPALGKMALMAGLPDISDVEVDKATTDFEWKDRALHLTNVDIRKTDVTRVAGMVDIDSAGQVDGRLRLGLPSSITGKWPDIQDKLFPVALEDYNWADVHLTGTPDHLKEDLSPRVLAAGLGQGSDLLNSAKQKATDLINNFLGK